MPQGYVIFDKYEFDHWTPARVKAWDNFVNQAEDVDTETYLNTNSQVMLKYSMNHPDFFDADSPLQYYITWGTAKESDGYNTRPVITNIHTLDDRGNIDGQRSYHYD